jgi:two-component system nitrate/nitrite response regulator NarL
MVTVADMTPLAKRSCSPINDLDISLSPRLRRDDPVRTGAPDKQEDQEDVAGLGTQTQLQSMNQQGTGKLRMPDKLKIVLVDDHGLFGRGLSELLTNCYDFNVLGAVGSIEELRVLINEQPDLLVMDLRMKPMDGLAMLEHLRTEGCTTPAVILTMSDSEVDLGNALRAGVRGYLLKDMEPEELVDAIHRVATGELVVAPSLTVKMIEILRGDQPGQGPKNSLKLLTKREREIMELLSRGESNKSIALTLSISYDTVKQHVRHILNKLSLSSRVKAAVLFAKENEKFE